MKIRLDQATTLNAEKDLLGNWTHFSATISTETETQVVDMLQVLSALDHRNWRITGDKADSLLDHATETLTEIFDEQERADERLSEMTAVVLKKQLPFWDEKHVIKGFDIANKGAL